jgi:hypothetical protein
VKKDIVELSLSELGGPLLFGLLASAQRPDDADANKESQALFYHGWL